MKANAERSFWIRHHRGVAKYALTIMLTIGYIAGGLHAGEEKTEKESNMAQEKTQQKLTLGAGCFWCTEAVFARLDGVTDVEVGYMGGEKDDPTYQEVCSGRTGHAEVAQITYDPDQVTVQKLLDTFWQMHDPTSLNRQGADVGTQYRSAIFYHTEAQKEAAEASKKKLDEAETYAKPIVTAIEPAGTFYPAEAYHQEYFRKNPKAGYCRVVIQPKLEKLEKKGVLEDDE